MLIPKATLIVPVAWSLGKDASAVCGISKFTLPVTKGLGTKYKEGRRNRYTFAGAEYFERMKAQGLYTIDSEEIKGRVEKLKLTDVLNQKLV